jgi:heme-degrading monooxygenase HmoA
MSALEVATVWITPGQEDAFAAAYRRARHLLTEIRGCLSVRWQPISWSFGPPRGSSSGVN